MVEMESVKPGYDRVNIFICVLSAYLISAFPFLSLKRYLEWGEGCSTNYKTIITNSKITEMSFSGQICKSCPEIFLT